MKRTAQPKVFQFYLVLMTSVAAVLDYHVVTYSRMCIEANMCGCK